jgi:hypothetical protein
LTYDPNDPMAPPAPYRLRNPTLVVPTTPGVYVPDADWGAVVAEQRRSGAPLTPVYEPVSGPWTAVLPAFAQLAQILPPAVAGSIVPLGRCEVFPGSPRTRVIQLFGEPYGVGLTGYLIRAIVEYGIGGIQNEIVVDFRHGSTLHLVCQTANVRLRFDAPGIDPYNVGSNTPLLLGAAYGDTPVSSGQSQPTLTSQAAELFNSGDLVEVTPLAFATRAFPLLGDNGGAAPTLTDFFLEQRDGSNNLLAVQVVTDNVLTNGVAIMGSAKTVQLRRASGGPDTVIGALMVQLGL